MEGSSLQVEGLEKAPELLVSEGSTKDKEPQKERKKSEGWSTEKMQEKASKQEFKETEEMVRWRSINQEGINNVWKNGLSIEE